jgi:hypothetical protein
MWSAKAIKGNHFRRLIPANETFQHFEPLCGALYEYVIY